jgi:exodeoxyribonuclease V alpha subunit
MNPNQDLSESGVSVTETPRFFEPEVRTVEGSVERVVYFDEENGQCVLDIRPAHSKQHILVSGRTPWAHEGHSIEAELLPSPAGELAGDVKKALYLDVKAPTQERTTKKFLKSDAFIDKLGPRLATLLAKAFPDNLFLILNYEPERLKEVPGVGEKRFLQIVEAWAEFKAFRELRYFLFENNLPLKWAWDLWRSQYFGSLDFLKTSPYECVIRYQFNFEMIDAFALSLGWARDSEARLRCALFDGLNTHYKQGHCAYPEEKLLQQVIGQYAGTVELIADESIAESFAESVEAAFEMLIVEDQFICESISGTACVYLKEVWLTEREVARKLLAFQDKIPSWGWINMNRTLGWAQKLLEIQLAPLQKQAIETALNSPLTVITGGPGTGKTTLIRSLVTILKTQSSSFALCSPTGRAAQKLEEATGTHAQTIHRLLKFDGLKKEFVFNARNPLSYDLVLVDEVSMVDLALMNHLLDALPEHCVLVLIGDSDQIPSVGAGNVLQSILNCERFSTVRLTEIYRQKNESLIKINARRINAGEMPLQAPVSGTADFHYIPVYGVEQTKELLAKLVTDVIPRQYGISDPRELQILVPLNRGPLGTLQLNEELKELFTLSGIPVIKKVSGFGQTFKTGDKVMVIKNDYKKDIFNGDIGFIEDIDHEGQFIDILFEGRQIRFGFEEMDRLTLAYAISIHKSQGSEYRAVIVVIAKEHLPQAQRHLLYTAVTRGKEHVFLVADPAALQSVVLSDGDSRRWQKLTELLQKSVPVKAKKRVS